MKKLLILALLLSLLIAPSLAVINDPYKMLTGKQIIPGAPWVKDDARLYFGADKDASIVWSSTYSKIQINGAMGNLTKQSSILTANTTLSATSFKPFYWLSAPSNKGLNITLPTAASMDNQTIEFVVRTANTGSCTTLLNGYGAETINNAATKAATAKYATIELKSSGTEWYIVKSVGTWS